MPESNYFKIGVFVLAGFGLFVAGLLAFGMRGRLISSNVLCVTFFNRSVQGLSKDAAVKFRGFTIGRVTALSLAAADDLGGQPMVRVDFEINPAAFDAQVPSFKDIPNFLRDEISNGLKVYLTLQGVTGLSFLDLNYGQEPRSLAPASEAAIERITRGGRLVYVPNGPSQIYEIGESISRLVRTINDIDLVELSRDIKYAVKTIDKAVSALDAGRLSREMTGTLVEVQALESSASQLRQSVKRLDQLLGSYSGGFPETLDNLRAITDNLREMSELLKNQPSQAVFGRPPRMTEPGRRENVTTLTRP
jgi:paraquat-inducible protein B